jgi:hypothetical protein
VEGVVDDDAWAAITLGDHAKRAEAKVGEVLDELIGEEDPLSLLHEGDDLLLKEVQVFGGRLVGAPGLGGIKLGLSPWSCGEGDRGAMAAEVVQQLGGPVWELADIGGKVGREAASLDELVPSVALVQAGIQNDKLT